MECGSCSKSSPPWASAISCAKPPWGAWPSRQCLYSILFLALVTASAVNICQAIMLAHRDESVAHFIYQLEHLPDLSREELAEVSDKVKRIGKRRRKGKDAFK